ncbi:hypothetical protein D3C72_2137570 [compost metagenome]
MFHNANGTSTKPASVVSLNSISVMNSCTASTKKQRMTVSQERNITAIVVKLANTSGKPASSLICRRIGSPAAMPVFARWPGCRKLSRLRVEPLAVSPNPAKDWKMMPASQLKLPMM